MSHDAVAGAALELIATLTSGQLQRATTLFATVGFPAAPTSVSLLATLATQPSSAVALGLAMAALQYARNQRHSATKYTQLLSSSATRYTWASLTVAFEVLESTQSW